jgi:hypothetical protein
VLKGFTWRIAAEGCVEQYRALLEDNARAAHDASVARSGVGSGASSGVGSGVGSGPSNGAAKAKNILTSATKTVSGATKNATEFAKTQAKNLGGK